MRKILSAVLILAAAASLGGCKTNQANMNDAYTKAMAGREDDLGLDSTIYSRERKQMKHGTMTVNGTEVPVSSQWVKVTAEGGGINESLRRYNVVVGQFKQVFNARSMRERLADDGYPGAFVVETGEPYYFVVASATDDASQAVEMLDHVKADPGLKMKSPLPFILQPAQYRR